MPTAVSKGCAREADSSICSTSWGFFDGAGRSSWRLGYPHDRKSDGPSYFRSVVRVAPRRAPRRGSGGTSTGVCGSGGTSTGGTSTAPRRGLWFGWHLDGGSVVRVAPRRGSVVRVAPRRQHLDGSTSTGSVVRVAPRRGLWFGWHLDGAPRRHLDGFGWHLDGTSTGTSTAPRRRLDGARTSLTSASTVLPSSLSAVLPESNRMAEGSFTTIRPRSIETSTWPLSIIAWNCSSPQGRVRAQLRGQLRQRGAGDAVETTPPSSGLGPSYYRSRPAHGMWHARC